MLKQCEQKKLILLVTDGEPADIDVRDPQYLRHDTKKAMEELATRGVRTFCLTLDPKADDYVLRIFGPKGFMGGWITSIACLSAYRCCTPASRDNLVISFPVLIRRSGFFVKRRHASSLG